LPLYKALEDGLEKYYNFKKQGGWANLEISTVIKPGETNDAITMLRERLLMEGYEVTGNGSALYDGQLVETMKRFQENHGLNPDGIIGKKTQIALNRTVDQKIDQLRINLERARWVLDNNEGKLLVVNIAKYRLYIFENDHRTYETNVMVGTQYTQTPVFMAPMRYIEFNPTWTVPFSICTKEILPKLKTDNNYLSARNMVVLDQSGTEIDQTKIDWVNYSAGNFPFVIRQEPGPQNALGRVKFMFPNEHAVYLHDTPSRYLFTKDSRAFSHGCVRVENPLKLAEVILNEPDKWNEESIQKIVDTNKTTRVNLKEPIPVLLMYWTAGLGSNGELFFVDDIYNRDERLLEAINNHNWDEMVINYRKSMSVQYKL
jgi:murein L,D-transpeptidase YcbB/YkuD